MGQYQTKRLKVTKSYIEYKNKRIEMSQIAEARQPQNDPGRIVVFLFLASVTLVYAIFRDSSLAWLLIIIWVLGVLGGLVPQNVVELRTVNGNFHRINVIDERDKKRAINTILENVKEYQSKPYPISLPGSIVGEGKARLNPEEYVRQYVLRLLVDKFGFSHTHLGYEFPIQIGSSQKRADVVIFSPGKPHTQENIFVIVECKRADIRNDQAAFTQLKSYLSVCVNAKYGVVASHRWRVVEKYLLGERYEFKELSYLPDIRGVPRDIQYEPGRFIELARTHNDAPHRNVPHDKNQNLLRIATNAAIAGGVAGLVLLAVTPYTPALDTPGQSSDLKAQVLSTPLRSLVARYTSTPYMTRTQKSAATNTPTRTMTAVPEPSVTLTLPPTPEPSPTPTVVVFGVIRAEQKVNVRQSDTREAIVIASVHPGTRVEVIDENADGSWLKVRLNDGTLGWVASFLVNIER